MIMLTSGNLFFFTLMFLGPLVSVSSTSWFICWAGVELSFIGVVPLLMSEKNISLSKESCLKYFCVQALGSGILMLGGILKFIFPWGGEFFFLFGILLKLGVFPMHFWVPSVVSGLNSFSLFLILSWQKIAPFMFLMNLVENCPWLHVYVLLLGSASALVGSLIGLNQTKLNPILGASSITHTGWALLACISGCFWFYFLLYCLSLALLTIFIILDEPFFASFFMFSLTGLPPFILFIGKWSVIKAAVSFSIPFWAVFLPVLGSVLSLFFYLKIFFVLLLEEKPSSKKIILGAFLSFILLCGAIFLILY